jgi:hypothetical protein
MSRRRAPRAHPLRLEASVRRTEVRESASPHHPAILHPFVFRMDIPIESFRFSEMLDPLRIRPWSSPGARRHSPHSRGSLGYPATWRGIVHLAGTSQKAFNVNEFSHPLRIDPSGSGPPPGTAGAPPPPRGFGASAGSTVLRFPDLVAMLDPALGRVDRPIESPGFSDLRHPLRTRLRPAPGVGAPHRRHPLARATWPRARCRGAPRDQAAPSAASLLAQATGCRLEARSGIAP